MIYDYVPVNFGDTNGNYVSCSPATNRLKLEFDRMSKLFTDKRTGYIAVLSVRTSDRISLQESHKVDTD